ncbi:MAG: L(+)-tartrate dehydratase subunit beta [Mogibacterium sp.]|nr:L(+)-tartrate dehydratase subunit beta [Mogibacterium sp.]MBR2389693.1 L(+)-tartrate dehydratase subunit beta [Mogibacterium sp.]MBR3331822.1 L(+)-tartrate dehydratase subunit beta [Mogibacterium sp.]MBR4091485.1 L(+)-tartrate dehydratase subunit beta [Mogibacterium sp.]
MTETINGRTTLTTPFTEEDIRALRTGDVIYISGDIVTGRDDVHIRAVSEGMDLPAEIRGKALMHAGPIVTGSAEDGYSLVAIGPTTSMRMEKLEYDFIKKTGVRLIIGKGGMGKRTAEACREFGAVHCVLPAGNAVFTALCTEEITDAGWLDLGMAEAFWSIRVRELGPLIVSIDSSGKNLFEEKKKEYASRKEEQLQKISKRLETIL